MFNKTHVRKIATMVVSLAVAGCADKQSASSIVQSTPPDSPVVAAETPPPLRPVVGRLKGLDHLLTIHTSSDGPRFTIASNGGEELAREIDLQELRSRFPQHHERYRNTFAQSGDFLDASNRSAGEFIDASF